jgi:hypothetical protein
LKSANTGKSSQPTVSPATRRKAQAEARIPLARICYSLAELETATSLSSDFFRLEIRRGNLRAFKLGTRTVVMAEDFEQYLLARRSESTGGGD